MKNHSSYGYAKPGLCRASLGEGSGTRSAGAIWVILLTYSISGSIIVFNMWNRRAGDAEAWNSGSAELRRYDRV